MTYLYGHRKDMELYIQHIRSLGRQHHTLAALPLGKSRYPSQEAGWASSRSGRERKFSPPQGFDPQTVLPVAISYADYVVPVTVRNGSVCK